MIFGRVWQGLGLVATSGPACLLGSNLKPQTALLNLL